MDVAGESPTEREAELVLVTPRGEVIGQLPPVRAGSEWWPEVESVVSRVRAQYGVEVVVLRLLSATRRRPHGGRVKYLAQVAAPVPCAPCHLLIEDHPLRPAYARPSGPDQELEWAARELGANRQTLQATQVKTWNLASLWRLDVAARTYWLKSVPHFFEHEGPLIGWLAARAPVPELLAHEGGRMLMGHVPGRDLFDASLEQRYAMVERLVALQVAGAVRVDELLALGLPDWRFGPLKSAICDVFTRHRSELSEPALPVLEHFIDTLHDRLAQLEACGVPQTLVHGDFHPGNVRGTDLDLTILDWGDAGVGHPYLDASAFLDMTPEPERELVTRRWQALWRDAIPGCQVEHAWALVAPLAAARRAVIYRRFLDNIEPSEHPYHRDDPRIWLEQVATLVGTAPASAR